MKSMKTRRIKLVIVLMALGLIVLSSVATGLSGYRSRLPDFGTNFSCETCHEEGGSTLNEFGVDFQANGNHYDNTLGEKDSDDDGYSNDDEFSASPVTNPGNANSHPVGPVVPPEPIEWDFIPWLLTIIAGVVVIFGVSIILILIAINKKPKGEKEK
jgi:hypothetical protein